MRNEFVPSALSYLVVRNNDLQGASRPLDSQAGLARNRPIRGLRYRFSAIGPDLQALLPDEVKRVVSLRAQGLSPAVVSQELGISRDVVKRLSSRAITELSGQGLLPVDAVIRRRAYGSLGIDQSSSGVQTGLQQEARPSFEEIFETYHERIYNCIYRLMGRVDEAQDYTQETFLRAYLGLPKIEGELRMGPWLYRIAINLCNDQLRRRKLVSHESMEQFALTYHPAQVARDNPERDAIRQESRELISEALQELPPRYRIALVLLEYQGLSTEEIAVAMNTTRSAAKSLLLRARRELRSQYLRLGGEPPEGWKQEVDK